MRAVAINILAFLVGALAGVLLLVIAAVSMGAIQMALIRATHPGVGEVAGGISESAVMLVPLLSGVIGVLLTSGRRVR